MWHKWEAETAGKEEVVEGKRVINTTALPRRLYHGMHAEREKGRERDREGETEKDCLIRCAAGSTS